MRGTGAGSSQGSSPPAGERPPAVSASSGSGEGTGPGASSEGGGLARLLRSPWLLLALAAIALVAVVAIGGRLRGLNAELQPTGKDILDLEFAFTERRAEAILAVWPAAAEPGERSARSLAVESLWVDFAFVAAYWLLFSSLYLLLHRQIHLHARACQSSRRRGEVSPRSRRLWLALGLLPTAGALFDVVENVLLLGILDTASGAIAPIPVALAGVLATAKFLVLAVATVPLLLVVIIRGRSFLQRWLPGEEDQAHFARTKDVIKAERNYLGTRRELAGLTGALRDAEQAVGVALSGGGVRSATLNLGALQGLLQLGLLPKVDYLATVSGGGYIGSWLSSLLSINSRHYVDLAPSGSDEQYRFEVRGEERDTPQFTTGPERTPFDGVQLDHLRTHGDFLILRRRLIHRDVLRVVGAVLGGLFYHVLMFFLVLAALAGIYLGVAQWIAGPLAEITPASSPLGGWSWRGPMVEVALVEPYVDRVLAPALAAGHPFWTAFWIGLLLSPALMLCISWMVFGSSLPDDWFTRGALSVEENRELHSLWALFCVTLLVAVVHVWALAAGYRDPSLLMVPMGLYLGGWLASLVLHALVALAPIFNRNARSRFAAWKGIFHYMAAASVIVVLLPVAIQWLATRSDFTLRTGGLAWLGGVVATWLLSSGGSESPVKRAGALLRRAAALSQALRNFLLGAAVMLATGGGLVFFCALIQRATAGAHDPAAAAFWIGAIALLLVVLFGVLLDYNQLSLHYFYRDRLVETYLQTLGPSRRGTGSGRHHDLQRGLVFHRDNSEMRLTDLHGSLATEAQAEPTRAVGKYFKRAFGGSSTGGGSAELQVCATAAPYHLVITCLNLTNSRDLRRRNRKSDHFIFSKLYCGSRTTGYMQTQRYRSGDTRLARAMTISGAAVSPAIGSRTFFAQAFATALFNIRLGQWMENPAYRDGARAHSRENAIFWPRYLVREMLAATDADSRLVYLSDGGHTGDNVGIGPLLERRCRLILAFDAECDPELRFGSLTEALRQAAIDRDVEIDIDLSPIYAKGPCKSERHVAVGRIDYGENDGERTFGWLLVFKSSLTGDEPEQIKNYARTNADFPNQTTGDLFFDDAQFEAYRELGRHQVIQAFDKELAAALGERWKDQWERELGGLVPPLRQGGDTA